ncbi:hypothetical protein SDC9_40253 [bioreactor metagenome]|uniref:Uncharacterized protein n=1 Tax=bioreactor metagenome TaxID=1076179 RepID=A0A644VRT4_9ZZZZ
MFGFVVAYRIGVNNKVFNFRNPLFKFACLFGSQCHEGGGIAIGRSTVGCDDGGTQDVLFGRISRNRIDGVTILLTTFFIKVTVISGGGQSHFTAQVCNLLQLLIQSGRIVGGFVYPDTPAFAFGIHPFGHHFAANFDHIVFDTLAFQ